MRKTALWAGLGALTLALGGPSRAREDRPAFRWETDLATARAKAKLEGRPLLVVFR